MSTIDRMRIRVVTGNDWGCEHTEADEAAYERAVAAAILAHYPSADIEVEVRGSTETKIRVYVCRPEDEPVIEEGVRGIMQWVWDDAEFWPS